MHNKDKVIFNKKLRYEYNVCLYILEELCGNGVIDVSYNKDTNKKEDDS